MTRSGRWSALTRLADTRLPAQPGRPARQDYEYRREGTRNLFLACEPKAGWRHVAVTESFPVRDLPSG